MSPKPFLLAAEGLNKNFSGFQAITNLSFYLDEGELRTVIGPNGAGKTTFLDLITGRTKPDTGTVRLVRYCAVDDCGTILNPLLCEGQIHGGIVHGLGQALLENAEYDPSGQLVSGSFMDYAMPRAEDVPVMGIGDHPSPAKTNPLGTKGCGEAGCAGSLCVIVNAVIDALSELGITEINMPLTPEKVWRAIRDAQKAKAA